jgi:hypothetical protein
MASSCYCLVLRVSCLVFVLFLSCLLVCVREVRLLLHVVFKYVVTFCFLHPSGQSNEYTSTDLRKMPFANEGEVGDATSWEEQEQDLQRQRREEIRRRQLYKQKIQLRRHKKLWAASSKSEPNESNRNNQPTPSSASITSRTKSGFTSQTDRNRESMLQVQQRGKVLSSPTSTSKSHRFKRSKSDRDAKGQERRKEKRASSQVWRGRKDGRHHTAQFPVDLLEALFDGTLNLNASDKLNSIGNIAAETEEMAPSHMGFRRASHGPDSDLYARRRLNDALEAASQEVHTNELSPSCETAQPEVEDYYSSDENDSAGNDSENISEDSWKQPSEGQAGYISDGAVEQEFGTMGNDSEGTVERKIRRQDVNLMEQASCGSPASLYEFALLSPEKQIERLGSAIIEYGHESTFCFLASQFVHEYSDDPAMLDISDFRCPELIVCLIQAVEKCPMSNLVEVLQLLGLLLYNNFNAEDAARANALSFILNRLKGVQASIREVDVKANRAEYEKKLGNETKCMWEEHKRNLLKVEALLIHASKQFISVSKSQSESRKIKKRLQQVKHFFSNDNNLCQSQTITSNISHV